MISAFYRWLLPLHRVELLTLTDWWAEMDHNVAWLCAHTDPITAAEGFARYLEVFR